MSFKNRPFWDNPGVPPVGGREAVRFVKRLNPRVFCVFARNKNWNLAVFEGVVKEGNLVGIEHYWLSLDKKFIAAARKKGVNHDREEMTIFDNIAYGFEQTVKEPSRKIKVRMHKLPSHPMTVVLHKNGHVNAYVALKGETYLMDYVWIEATIPKTLVEWPRFLYMDIFGTHLKTRKPGYERIDHRKKK